jgi:hypothetical protein
MDGQCESHWPPTPAVERRSVVKRWIATRDPRP